MNVQQYVHFTPPYLSEPTTPSKTTFNLEDSGDQDLPVQADLVGQRRPATSVREPGHQAAVVASTHPPLGGNEEDGRPQVSRAQQHQLHRDTEAVSGHGEADKCRLKIFSSTRHKYFYRDTNTSATTPPRTSTPTTTRTRLCSRSVHT